jgi:hypothetical protein
MRLKQWADNGWLKPHQTSWKEIKNLLDDANGLFYFSGAALDI